MDESGATSANQLHTLGQNKMRHTTMETVNDFRNEPSKENEVNETRPESAIADIALKKGLQYEKVKQIYDRLVVEMEREARIRDYIAIFAARKVEQYLDQEAV